tara:strand:- start:158 stop:763 length:606 start_codon:yes stop_codon:yes gene_type:complete
MNIIPLFPTPIGQVSDFITDDERLELIKFIKNTKHVEHGSIRGDGVSTFNNNSYGVSKNLKDRLEQQVNNYAQEYGVSPNLTLDNIWSNIQNVGSVLDEHYHANSIVSGALYLNVNDSCYLTFHNPNPYIYFTEIVEHNPCNFEWQRYFVKNGDLILFPSWLKHGHHDHVNTMDNRMVISFNTNFFKKKQQPKPQPRGFGQ